MNQTQDEYIREKLAEMNRYQPAQNVFDAYHADPHNIWNRRDIANTARDFAFAHPRAGQPELSYSPLTQKIWLAEGLKREAEIRAHWLKKALKTG